MTNIANILGVIVTGFLLFGFVTMTSNVDNLGFSGTFGHATLAKFPHWFNQSTRFYQVNEKNETLELDDKATSGQFISTGLTLENRPYKITNITYDSYLDNDDQEIILFVNRTQKKIDPSFNLKNGTNFIKLNHTLNGEDLQLEVDLSRGTTSNPSPELKSLTIEGQVNRGSETSRFTQNLVKLLILSLVMVSIVLILGD